MKPLTKKQLQREHDELMLKEALLADMEAFTDRSASTAEPLDETIPQKAIERSFRKKKLHRHSIRAAVILAAVIAILTAAMTASAEKPWIIKMIESLNGEAYYHPYQNAGIDWTGICIPEKIPGDFLLTYYNAAAGVFQFESEGGQTLSFTQGTEKVSGIVDMENLELYEKITVNSCDGVHTRKEGVDKIYWDGPVHTFTLWGSLSYQELLEIAQSVKDE